MLDKEMIKIFLNATGLSEPELPSKLYDIILPIDIVTGCETDVNKFASYLNDDQTKDFYKTLILGWLLDTPPINSYSWGWMRTNEEDGWHVTPITYSMSCIDQKEYTVNGASYAPDNMLLFSSNSKVYMKLLSMAKKACTDFIDSYRLYDHSEVPIDKQVNFVSSIENKVREMTEALSLVMLPA